MLTLRIACCPNICLVSRYRVSGLDLEGRVTNVNAMMLEFLYPPSPPDAEPYATLKYREFMTVSGLRNQLHGIGADDD
jgi:hypothetical protein